MTCTSFSSSGSLRKSLVFVESSFRSTRKSFWDSTISIPCLSSWDCSVVKSMSRHLRGPFGRHSLWVRRIRRRRLRLGSF